MTLFFPSFCRILDLEVEQNQTQEETLPSSGSWLFRPSLVFLLLPPTLTPIPWQPHSCHKCRGVPERDDKRRLWTMPQRGSRKQKLLEKRSVAAAAIHNNVQHQLTAPGCHSRLWQKLRVVHPSLSSNEFVDRDGGRRWERSGNDLWVRRFPAGRQAPPGLWWFKGSVLPGLFDQGSSWHL